MLDHDTLEGLDPSCGVRSAAPLRWDDMRRQRARDRLSRVIELANALALAFDDVETVPLAQHAPEWTYALVDEFGSAGAAAIVAATDVFNAAGCAGEG